MGNAVIASIGVAIHIEVDMDLTSATTLEIRFTRDDGSTGKWDDTTDGVNYSTSNSKHYVNFVTDDVGDIAVAGVWTFQVRAVGPGYDLKGDQVSYNFDEPMAGDFS